MVQKWIRRGVLFFVIIIFLVAGFLLFLHTATGKSMVRSKVQDYLQQKWKTKVWIGKIDYSLPNWIALERVVILDRQMDTMLNGGRIYVGVKLLKLLSNTVDVTGVHLENINLHCHREAGDSVFNFQFILDAFAPSGNKVEVKPKGSPMQLSLRKLTLNNVRLNFSDQKQQLYFSTIINDLSCFPELLYPERKVYRFNDLVLRNTHVIMVDSAAEGSRNQNSIKNRGNPASLLLSLNTLRLHNVFFSYKQPLLKTDYTFHIDSLQLSHASLDLSGQRVSAENVHLSNSAVKLLAWVPARSIPKKAKETSLTNPQNKWKFSIEAISLRNNSFVYNNVAVPRVKGLDYQHINAQNINLQTRKSSFDSSGFFSKLDALSLLYNNQFHIKQVRADVRFSESVVHVQDLVASINQSQLTTYGDLVWPLKSGAHLSSLPQFLIETSSLSYSDLLLIQPELQKRMPLSLSPSEKIIVTGNFSGTLQNLNAKQISVITSDKRLQLKGSVHFLLRKTGPEITATFHQLQLKKRLLSKGLLKRLQHEKIYLPEEITLTGKMQVNPERMFAAIKLNSSFGQLLINGTVTNIRYPKLLAYNLILDAHHFETGKWIGLDSVLGKITGRVFVKGSGMQKNNVVATSQLQLQTAVLNGYPFSNIDLQAGLDRSEFTVLSSIQDQNLETDLHLSGRIDPDISVRGTIQVKRADAYKLGLTSDSLVYGGNIRLDASYGPPNKIDAFIRADSNQVFIGGKHIVIDSLLFTCMANKDTMLLTANASFLDARLGGNYPINALSSQITSIWKMLYPFHDPEPEKQHTRKTAYHRTSLDVMLKQDSLIHVILPKLELKQPLTIKGMYTTEQKDTLLSVQLIMPEVRYNKYEGYDLQVTANTIDSVMQFSLTGREFHNGRDRLTTAHLAGFMQKGLLMLKGRVNDSTGKEYYSTNVEVKKEKDEMSIRFLDDLTLNRNKWKVSSNNLIRIVKQGYIINHLLLENRGQKVFINTKGQQVLSPIDIQINSFDISHIFNLLSYGDTLDAKGVLNADISMQQPIGKVPVVTGDIRVTNLALFAIPIGDLRFHSSSIGDSLSLQGGLTGENQLGFNGRMHLVNGGIRLQTRLNKLNTNMVQYFAKDFITQLSGKITGDLQLAGSLDTPHFAGAIYLDSVAFALKALNTVYRIDKQKLVIDYPYLSFGQLALTDSAGHLLTIQGRASLFSPGEKRLDVSIDTKEFIVLNAIRKSDASLYGIGIMDAKVAIKGTVEAPIIDGNAYLHKNSHIHFVNTPKRNSTQVRKDGILFVDIDTLASHKGEEAQLLSDSVVARSTLKGLKYNLNLKVDKDAEFSIVIDPSTNDEMVLKGEARLNAGLAENGDIGIEGVYNLQSGYYKMNNLLLRGKFQLVKGSSISFNGNPALAEADVTTEYVIEASPKGLLNYKEDDDASYTQRVPFAVIFMIKGAVSKPELSFDIQLKEGKAVLKSSVKSDVEHALDRLRNDVSEMNKQVFSLLLTKQFSVSTGHNTLESSNLNANNALKEGVSSFLSEAMNQMADQLIKGVDVDVNMKTYKTEDDPISKTDLGVAMSKDLFQDRLVIRIEESFAVGSTSSAPVKSGSQYVPDITSTYKLSKDGRFQLKGYQKNEYDAVVQGYFTEVGINFTIELSYEKFKELVRSRKNMSNGKK